MAQVMEAGGQNDAPVQMLPMQTASPAPGSQQTSRALQATLSPTQGGGETLRQILLFSSGFGS
jgi:hypothetical protein